MVMVQVKSMLAIIPVLSGICKTMEGIRRDYSRQRMDKAQYNGSIYIIRNIQGVQELLEEWELGRVV